MTNTIKNRLLTVTNPLSWNMYFKPSWTSWWARQTRSSLLMWLNCKSCAKYLFETMITTIINILSLHTSEVTLDPKSQPAPRGLTAHVSISSGSLHIRSQKGPSCGISQLRSITLICHIIYKEGRNISSACAHILNRRKIMQNGENINLAKKFIKSIDIGTIISRESSSNHIEEEKDLIWSPDTQHVVRY